MNNSSEIALYSAIWIVGIVVFVTYIRRSKYITSGLSLIYIANLALIHFFGSVFFIFPTYSGLDLYHTILGFKYATIALVSFIIGNILYTGFSKKRFIKSKLNFRKNARLIKTLPLLFLLLGILIHFLRYMVGQLPTLTVFLSVGFQLIVVSICLYSHVAYNKHEDRKIYIYILLSFLIPIFILLTEGFLGYGISMLISIIIFVDNFSNLGFKKISVLILLSYMGLSFYVNYISDREDLRESVWEDEPLDERLENLKVIFEDFEFFNPNNREHLYLINKRLNQNSIVGVSAEYVNGNVGHFAKGETYKLSVYNLIPRIIWKDKPISAGNTEIVEKYTGMRFMEGTSVGMPQVMEMYINFGMTSLVFGFLFIGAFFSYFDLRAGFYLETFQYDRFILYFLPPLAFMRSETPTIECLSAFVASFVLVFGITRVTKRHLKPAFLVFTLILMLVSLRLFYLPTIDPLLGYLKYPVVIAVIILIVIVISKKQKRY